MKICGIDPGKETTSFAIVEKDHNGNLRIHSYGTIKDPRDAGRVIADNMIAHNCRMAHIEFPDQSKGREVTHALLLICLIAANIGVDVTTSFALSGIGTPAVLFIKASELNRDLGPNKGRKRIFERLLKGVNTNEHVRDAALIAIRGHGINLK